MKNAIYTLLKPVIRAGFFFYYREVRILGTDHIPEGKPVIFLPNHQNALLDPLILAAFAQKKRPYFLTLSDVFQGRALRWFFSALRMIPIYRIRDGRDTLWRNEEIFDRCAALLARGEHLLLFPEANHNLHRRVRPLSKGFTRIVLHTLKMYPKTDLHLLPVGINYESAAGFPDRVAFRIGTPLRARSFMEAGDEAAIAREMKRAVSQQLRTLTVHIPADRDHDMAVERLRGEDADWLYPGPINRFLQGGEGDLVRRSPRNAWPYRLWDRVFRLVNGPAWVLWRWIARNKIWEPEFISTFRFGYGLLALPVYFLLIFAGCYLAGYPRAAVAIPGILLLHNLAYVKFR